MRGLKLIFFLLTYVSASKSFHFEISATKSSSHLHRRNGSLFPTQKQIDGNEAFQLSKLSSSANDESFANIESVGNATIPLSINRNIRPNEMDSLSSFEHVISKAIQQKSGPDPTTKSFLSTTTLSYTNLWTSAMWEKHNSRYRFIRYIIGMPKSRLLKRILPILSILIGWSTLVVTLSRNNLAGNFFSIPMIPLSLMSTFVAALLTLRSNQGLSRLNEARIAWGRNLLLTRDTAQLLATYIYPANTKAGLLTARSLSLFGWLLKCRLRDEDDQEIIETVLPYPFSSYVNSQRKKPAALIAQIRQTIAQVARDGEVPSAGLRSIEANLLELNRVFGICERLRGSPIPPVYTAHTSRLLIFYLFMLPCALLGQVERGIVVIAATALVGFSMLGLDEISHVLELPFRIIPMHPMAAGSMRDVSDAFRCQPPSLDTPYEDARGKPLYW